MQNFFDEFRGAISELFPSDEQYVFLVGAGISMGFPSNLPSARRITKSLFKLFSPEEELEKLMSLHQLRYELIVEKIQKFFDKDLKFLDFLEIIDTPNFIHFFLAKVILKKHTVFTTNFDYLLERALMQLVSEEQHGLIKPIITRNDYRDFKERYNPDIEELPIIKLHGSKKNILTSVDTQNTMVTTVKSFGLNRLSRDTFSIELWKKDVITKLMKNKILVVLGYSGGDDFDITPIIKSLPEIKQIIWLDHSNDETPLIYSVRAITNITQREKIPKPGNILAEIAAKNRLVKVYYIKANTEKFIKEKIWRTFFDQKRDLDEIGEYLKREIKEPINFDLWVRKTYVNVSKIDKYLMVCELYQDLKLADYMLICAKKGLILSEGNKELSLKPFFLRIKALSLYYFGKNDEAISFFEESLQIYRELGNIKEIIKNLNSLGVIFTGERDYVRAQHYLLDALKLATNFQQSEDSKFGLDLFDSKSDKDFGLIAETSTNIAELFVKTGQYKQALTSLSISQTFSEDVGDLWLKSRILSIKGLVLQNSGQPLKAYEAYNESLLLAESLGDLDLEQNLLLNIAWLNYHYFDRLDVSVEKTLKALKIAEKLKTNERILELILNLSYFYEHMGNEKESEKYIEQIELMLKNSNDIHEKAQFHFTLGEFYFNKEKKEKKSLYFLENVVKIYENLQPKTNFIYSLLMIGEIYKKKGSLLDALKYYERALRAAESSKIIGAILDVQFMRALCYNYFEQVEKSIKCFEQLLERIEETYNQHFKFQVYNSLGKIYMKKKETQKLISSYEKALEFVYVLENDNHEREICYIIGDLYKKEKKFLKALKYYNRLKKIFLKLQKNPPELKEFSIILIEIGDLYFLLGATNYAISNYTQSQKIAIHINNALLVSSTNYKIGEIYYVTGSYQSAKKEFKNALEILEKNNLHKYCKNILVAMESLEHQKDSLMEFNRIYTVGLDYYNKKEFSNCIESLNSALLPVRNLKTRILEIDLLMTIGLAYQAMKEFSLAMEKYQKGLQLCNETNNIFSKASFLNAIGMCIIKSHEFKDSDALLKFEDALKIHEELNTLQELAADYMNIGYYYYISAGFGDLSPTLSNYKKAYAIYDKLGDKLNVGICFLKIGEVHSEELKYDLSLEYLRKSEKIFASLMNKLSDTSNEFMSSDFSQVSYYNSYIKEKIVEIEKLKVFMAKKKKF